MSTLSLDDVLAHGARALPPAEESLESLYEDAPCGYFSTWLDGSFVRANRTLLTWTGYSSEQLLHGRRFRDLLTPGGRIFHETHYAPLLMMQGRVCELALEVVRADGSTFPSLLNSVLHRDESGRPVFIRTVLFDATDRRGYERELLIARRAAELTAKNKADVVSMLSHDIRTPLSALMCMAELLEGSQLGSDQKRYLGLLQEGAGSLMALVDNVLQCSQLENRQVRLDERPLDLKQLVHSNVDQLRARAEQKGLRCQVALDERIPATLLVDRVKVGQILTNLLGNAIKFTDHGTISVALELGALRDARARVDVTISDTGIGIDDSRPDELFGEFTQQHQHTGRDFGGHGLGLAITKKLVALHGGTISAASRQGGGSVFAFSLWLTVPAVSV